MSELEPLLQGDTALADLAEHNIGRAVSGCPAVVISGFDGAPAFPVPEHGVEFVRVACVGPSFPHAMSMARRVRELLTSVPLTFNVGGQSDVSGRTHTISTDFEVWTKPE